MIVNPFCQRVADELVLRSGVSRERAWGLIVAVRLGGWKYDLPKPRPNVMIGSNAMMSIGGGKAFPVSSFSMDITVA